MNSPSAPSQPATAGPKSALPVESQRTAFAIAWAALIAIGGGFALGFLMSQATLKTNYGFAGALLFWGLGAVAGVVGRKITGGPSRAAAWAIVAGCIVAFALAEVAWYHWCFNIADATTNEFRPQSWSESFALTPKALYDKHPITLVLGLLCTAFGAHEGFRRVSAGSAPGGS